jgi:hypothetical protein
MKLSRIGIDLAKNVYQLHGVDRYGKAVWKRRLKRHQWPKVLLDNTESGCLLGMEACAGAPGSGGSGREERFGRQGTTIALQQAACNRSGSAILKTRSGY